MADTLVESATERQRRLLAWIEQRERVSVPEIIDRFAVSPATARRDLEVLAGEGKVQRVHGGAIAMRRTPPEPPVMQRALEQAEEKRRIAVAAATLIADGETIFLSSGTTSWAKSTARAVAAPTAIDSITTSTARVRITASPATSPARRRGAGPTPSPRRSRRP